MINEIENILEKEVRPHLYKHRGDIKLIGYEDGVVEVTMLGACSGCPSIKSTIEELVETNLKAKLPEIQKVRLINEVSDEMWEMAKKILNKEI